MRRYQESIDALNAALSLSPDDPLIYGEMAHAYAQLDEREQTLRYVACGRAARWRSVGDPARYRRRAADPRRPQGGDGSLCPALDAPDANRVDARLAIAHAHGEVWPRRRRQAADQPRLCREPHWRSSAGHRRQPDRSRKPVAGDARLRSCHRLLREGEQAGAARRVVAIGLANTYLAQGKTKEADAAAGHARRRSFGQSELRLPAGAKRGLSAASRELERAAGAVAGRRSLAAATIAQLEGMQVAERRRLCASTITSAC